MPAEETPPNSPCVHSDLSDSEDDILLNENDVVEVLDDDGDNETLAVLDSEEEKEETGIFEDQEFMPERDDAQLIFKEHQDGVLCCDFHPNSTSMVVTGGIDEVAYVWNPIDGKKHFTCKGHEDSVESVSFSHDGSYLATGDLNGVIKVWRTRDFVLIETFELDDELSWMLWHSRTNVLVASSQIGMIYMYKIPSGERKMVVASFGKNCAAGKILSNGKSLACGYKDGTLKIIDLKEGTTLNEVKPSDDLGAITCIDVHYSNHLIICGFESGAVILINSNSGKVTSVLQGVQNSDGGNYIETASFCKDPSYPVAATGSLDGSLIIWDIVRRTLRHQYKFSSCVNQLAWHTNTFVLFTCNFEGVTHAYDAKGGRILRDYMGHQKSCLNMTLSSDGSYLMTTSEDKTVRIFCVSNVFQLINE